MNQAIVLHHLHCRIVRTNEVSICTHSTLSTEAVANIRSATCPSRTVYDSQCAHMGQGWSTVQVCRGHGTPLQQL